MIQPVGSLARMAAIQLLAGLIWMLPVVIEPSGIPFWRGGEYSDLLISHWPNAWFIRHSLAEWGQLPLWNPMILAGAPFAADPLAGLWYPPSWLAVLLPTGPTFSLLMWLHLAWAGSGMWLMLRRMGLAWPSALLASLAFSGTPKLLGHVGLGHLGLVSAVSWTPWVLSAVFAAADVRIGAPADGLRRSALAGALLGLVFLADPRWALPLAVLSLAAGMWRLWQGPLRETIGRRDLLLPGIRASIGRGATALAFAVATAAILALPLQEFTALSTRSQLGQLDSGALALPVPRLLGVLAPDLGGWPEWQSYAGITVLALGLAALWGQAKGRIFWAGWVGACLLLALGNSTPLHGWMTRLVPGYALLRVPARWLLAAAFGMSVLAGLGLERLLDRPFAGQVRSRFNLTVFGLFGVLIALALVLWLPGGAIGRQRALPYAISAGWLGAVVVWVRIHRGIAPRWLAFGLTALVMLDLALVDISEVESRRASTQSATVAALAERLTPGVPERIFSPSYSLPQPDAAFAGLELVDGINPLQLRSLRAYMAGATGFSPDAYSVTLPPFLEGDPKLPWGVQPDAGRLGRLNVAYLASAYPLQRDGWGFAGGAGGAYLYRNGLTRPRAWVELDGDGEMWRAVSGLRWSPNRIRLRAEGPGLLVVSELAYPGWLAEVDGEPVEWAAGAAPLRAVRLPEGMHQVELLFRPWTVFAGSALTAVGIALLAALWLVKT